MRDRSADGLSGPLRALWDGGSLAGLGDGPLLARFAERRDEAAELAFEALIGRHGPMVLRVCQQLLGDRHAAEDAFQAVFLVLARRAGSIREPDRLAPWLHGVALKTAREARARAGRRRRVEQKGAEQGRGEVADPTACPSITLARAEAAKALQEAIDRLPGRYRDPVVLCELEGLTHQEAALRLRCPVGTVGVRLMRARERLRGQLARRGLDSPAALGSLGWLGSGIPSTVSPGLLESTLGGSVRFATGRVAAGTVPASVLTLANGVLLTMTIFKLKLATAGVLVLGLAGTGAWAEFHRPAQAEPAEPAKKQEVAQEPAPAPDFPAEGIGRAIRRDIRDYSELVGRTEPARFLELRAQNAGPLEKVAVRTGQEVKAGALLFEVAAKSSHADVDRAEAEVRQAQSRVNLHVSQYERIRDLVKRSAVDASLLIQAEADVEQSKAAVDGLKAGLAQARRNLEAAEIRAPFAGRVEVRQAEPGMIVKGGETILGTLASVDPVAVTFGVAETTFLKIRRQLRGKKGDDADLLPVRASLSDETDYPHRGQFHFEGGQPDPANGTFLMRAEFPNADRLLIPGLFVRVRLETGEPRPRLLVPEKAVKVEGGRPVLHFVNDRNVVEARRIGLGSQSDGLWWVAEGLKPDDRFIIGDPEWGKPGMTIKEKEPAAKP